MGRDLGRAPLMCCRTRPLGALLGGAVLAAALLGLGAGPASAEPTPSPAPTPSVSPPSQQQIDDAKAALERLRNQGKSPTAQLSQVAGPAAAEASGKKNGGVTSRISDEAWWTIGAGLLVLLVATETTRLSVRRAKHRKGA
jgi:hypothetical protein